MNHMENMDGHKKEPLKALFYVSGNLLGKSISKIPLYKGNWFLKYPQNLVP